MTEVPDNLVVAAWAGLIVVLVVALAGKLSSLRSFRETVAALDFLPSWLVGVVTVVIPLAEAVGLVLLIIEPHQGGVLIAGLLLLMSAVAIHVWRRGRHIACSCFGVIRAGKLGPTTVVRNAVLLAASLLIVIDVPRTSFSDVPLVILGGTAAFLLLAMEELLPDALRPADRTLALMDDARRSA